MDRPEIYQPEEDSFLLEAEVKKFAHGRVLDMGTGSGIQATAAAMKFDVREVVAVDINKDAIAALKEKNIAKVRANKSNLFESVKGRFDTIIFNPPYLPTEEEDADAALDGGEKGHELIEKFLVDAKPHLEKNGFILLLYSNKSGDAEKIIKKLGYKKELLSKISLPFFEELYVVRLAPMAGKEQFSHGKRGVIYLEGNVCIKEKNPDSKTDTLAIEAEFLRILNKKNIGPKFISFDGKKLKREFVEGKELGEFLEIAPKKKIIDVLIQILNQCREMDKLGINKTELTNPYRDIIVTKKNKAVLIDFERCRRSPKVQNVTQFLQFIMKKKPVLEGKGMMLKAANIMELGKKYKQFGDDKTFSSIIGIFR